MIRDEQLLGAFAEELKHRRQKRGFSQEELAARAGINRTYVAKIELSDNQPTLGVMHALAKALDIDLTALVEGTLGRYKRRPHTKPKPPK